MALQCDSNHGPYFRSLVNDIQYEEDTKGGRRVVDSEVSLIENVISMEESMQLLEDLAAQLPWKLENDNFGAQTRETCYFGDLGAVFTYVGLRLEPAPWPKSLERLRQRVAEACGVPPSTLTACLANHYPTGQGHIPWHYDEVRAHGEIKVVASLSLGGPRRFQLRKRPKNDTNVKRDNGDRNKEDSTMMVADILLPSRSVIFMKGNAQSDYEHCLPLSSPKQHDPHRISLTFRSIVPGYEDDTMGSSTAQDACCT